MRDIDDENERIANALEGLIWPNMAIGNKVIIKAAIAALRKERERAEPVAWVPKSQIDLLKKFRMVEADMSSMQRFDETPLYTAPPAPVVPDAATAIRACLDEFPESVHDIVEECAAIAENACRAAMLNQK